MMLEHIGYRENRKSLLHACCGAGVASLGAIPAEPDGVEVAPKYLKIALANHTICPKCYKVWASTYSPSELELFGLPEATGTSPLCLPPITENLPCTYCGKTVRDGDYADPCEDCRAKARELWEQGFILQRDGSTNKREDWEPNYKAASHD